jgi:hypothetical protein
MDTGRNTRHTQSKILSFIGYGLLITALGVAGSIKLSDMDSFKNVLKSSNLLPDQLSYLIAYSLPLLEILSAYMLLHKSLRKPGLILACLLFISFCAWLTLLIVLNIDIECGCFGNWDLKNTSPQIALIRSGCLLGVSLGLLFLKDGKEPKELQK